MKTVNLGESITIGEYVLTFNGLTEHTENGNGIVVADLATVYRGKDVGVIQPEKVFYGSWPEPSTEVAIKTNWKEDLYVVLSSWENREKVTLQVKVNPFVSWIWLGGIIMVIGTAVALIGGKTSTVGIMKALRSGR
jgi:cytochrome c-type biogenesis protein CcmF